VSQARVGVAVQLLSGVVIVFGIHSAEQYREASAAITRFLPPFPGLGILESPSTQGAARSCGLPPLALPWAIIFRAFGPFSLSLVTSAATAAIRVHW